MFFIRLQINHLQFQVKYTYQKVNYNQHMGKGKILQALNLAGSEFKYQKILIALISSSWIVLNFVLLGSTFIFMDPVFHCNQNFEKKIFQKQACPQINQCELVQKFTLTSHMHLYCENEWARDLIQSIFGVGSMCGLLVMNLVSDTKSRKLAILLCFLIVFFGLSMTAIGGWAKSIATVIVAQFIQAFGISSIVPLSYAFLSDFCNDIIKPRAVIIVNTAWSLSTILLGVFYLTSVEWYVFTVFITLLPLLAVGILFKIFLLESPYILMLRNKRQQAVEVLQKVAMINNRIQHIPRINQIIIGQQDKTVNNQASIRNVLKILKQWQFLKPLIIVSLIRIVGTMNFYGTSYAFDVEGLGLGYNSMIAGFLEIISFFVLTVYINRIPRKKGIAGFYFIVLLIGLLFLFQFVKQNLVIVTMLMGTSRIFSTISYTLIASIQTQAFTVEIQSTAVGITEIFGLTGSMSGPLLVDLADKIDIDPIALIAILVNFAIWPTFFLKETLKTQTDKEGKQPLLEDPDQMDHYKESILSQSTIIGSEDN